MNKNFGLTGVGGMVILQAEGFKIGAESRNKRVEVKEECYV